MSVVYQNFFPDPHWVKPLLRHVEEQLRVLSKKVGLVSIITFSLDWFNKGKEIEIEMKPMSSKYEELFLFPQGQPCRQVIQREMTTPATRVKFDEKLFRSQVIKKSIWLAEQPNCVISCSLTIFGANRSSETAVFNIKEG